MEFRQIKNIVTGKPTVDGAGVHLTRVLGPETVEVFDPFLMLDAFDSSNPDEYMAGFPMHPHRGIETLTYLLEGEIEHQDSLGRKGIIRAGECQWMTSGSGILHQEMPRRSRRLFGLQLWVNLPKRHKMARPKYRGIDVADIPAVESDSCTVRILAGEYDGVSGAITPDYVQVRYLDVELKPWASFEWRTPAWETMFAYVLEGGVTPEGSATPLERRQAALFTHAEKLKIRAGGEGARLVLLCAPPLGESVAWGGPIVMNTAEELDQAFRELRDGAFIKYN